MAMIIRSQAGWARWRSGKVTKTVVTNTGYSTNVLVTTSNFVHYVSKADGNRVWYIVSESWNNCTS